MVVLVFGRHISDGVNFDVIIHILRAPQNVIFQASYTQKFIIYLFRFFPVPVRYVMCERDH